jgi:hypothetical protein
MPMDMPGICLVMPNERLDGSDSSSFGPVLSCLFSRGRGLQALKSQRDFNDASVCLPKTRPLRSESTSDVQRLANASLLQLLSSYDGLIQPLNIILMRFLKLRCYLSHTSIIAIIPNNARVKFM